MEKVESVIELLSDCEVPLITPIKKKIVKFEDPFKDLPDFINYDLGLNDDEVQPLIKKKSKKIEEKKDKPKKKWNLFGRFWWWIEKRK